MVDLQKIIIDFCIDHIKWLVLLDFITFIFVLVGREREWGEVRKVIEIIFAILTVILVVLILIYVAPFIKNSFFG